MTNPKGFWPWKPNKNYKALLPEVLAVIEADVENWPLTQRTWLYRLMGKYGWVKHTMVPGPDDTLIELTKKKDLRYNYRCEDSLQYILARGRRAALIPSEAVASGRGVFIEPGGFSSAERLADTMVYVIKQARSKRQTGQARHVGLWIETEGMVPLVENIAKDFGAFLGAGQGFDTLTNKHELAEKIVQYGAVLILHVGDLDSSGHTICTALDQDLTAFAKEMGGHIEMQRIALTEEQVHEYNLPSVPRDKTTDRSNHGTGFESDLICQAEALPPGELRQIVREAFEQALDMEIYNAQVDSEPQLRKDALEVLSRLIDEEENDQD